MKTLILASSGQFIANNNIDAYLPKPLKDCKIAYITTAGDKVSDREYIKIHKANMEKMNLSYTEIDIAGQKEEELMQDLSKYDVIYVEGGNTYYLLKAVRESGFERAIRKLLSQGKIYIGTSAGTYIACPSIIMANWSLRHNFDRCGITDFTAMSLVPFVIKAHYTEEYKEILEKEKRKLQYPLKVLTDDQAFLVQDDKVKFIGQGEEVII